MIRKYFPTLREDEFIHWYFLAVLSKQKSFNHFMILWEKLQKIKTTYPTTWLIAQLSINFAAI